MVFEIVHFLVQEKRDSKMNSISLYSEKINTFMCHILPVQQLQYSKHQILSSLLHCVTADVGLEANLYANCFFSVHQRCLPTMSNNEYRKHVT